MISKKMSDAMNEQIKNEFESAYLYLSMVAYFQTEGLDGMAQWMKAQTQEEMLHAMKFFDHINERGGSIVLKPLNILKTQWSSPLDAFKDAHKHEQFITSKINDLMKIAEDENDYAVKVMLDWFVNEQVEEEDTVLKIVQTLERIGDFGHGIIMLDRELNQRVFTPNEPAE